MVMFDEELVESVFVSVDCSLLLQDASESNSAANKEAEIDLAEIIVVVLRIKKCGAEEVYKGYVVVKFTIKAEQWFPLTGN